jgi:phytoene desaturase
MERLEKRIGETVREKVLVRHHYGPDELRRDHHAFRGNAYGLANTLRQTALLKPSMKSRKVPGLYFAGQTTVPGPGVPPSLISGELAAQLLSKDLERG